MSRSISPVTLGPVARTRPTALALACATLTGLAWAEPATRLQPIEVNAAATPYVETRTTAGSRTDVPVAAIPQSIVTVNRALIEDQGARNLSDALRNVSSVTSPDPRDSNNIGFRIRGFKAATVVDGIAMPGYFPNQESLVNIERIDVVKGPSGGLFGAQSVGGFDTTGGTVQITTSAPQPTAIRNLGLRLGSDQEKGVSFDLNQPLSPEWAARLVGEWSDVDSETDRLFLKRQALFPSLSYKPGGGTEVTLRLRHVKNTTLDFSGLPVTGTLDTSDIKLRRSLNIAAEGLPDTELTSEGVNLQWNQRLNPDWTFNLTAGYNTVEVDQRGTWAVDALFVAFDPAFACFGYGSVSTTSNVMCGAYLQDKFRTTTISPSLSGRVTLGSTKHVLSVGLDREVTDDDAFMRYPGGGTGLLSMTPFDLRNPVFPRWVEPSAAETMLVQDNRYTATVAYVQDQIDWGNWHFLGSLRYSDIEVQTSNPKANTASKATPRLGAVYDFTPQVSAFVGYGEAIKVPVGTLFSQPPKAEEAQQTEVGVRLKGLAGVTATLAWFDLKRKNVAVSDPAAPFSSIQVGEQQSKGVDADIHWQVNGAWSWLASFTHQTPEVTRDTNATLVGKQLFNVPEQQARVSTRYDIRSGDLAGLGFGAGITYTDRLPVNTLNTSFTPSSTVADAQVSYLRGNARYGLNVFNLTDKKYFVPSNYFGGNQVIAAPRRTLSVTANFAF